MSVDLPATERVMADLQRRVLALETTARVGINRAVSVWGTAAVAPTVFGTDEFGAAGTTWAASDGTSGTGYAEVSVMLQSRAIVAFTARVSDIGEDAGTVWRSHGGYAGVSLNGAAIGFHPAPVMQRLFINQNTRRVYVPLAFTVTRSFSPGVNTFRIGANWADTFPAAPTPPLLSDVTLTVIPLD